jgi:hypothetical protein
MSTSLNKLKAHLEPGKVYRRGDLEKWSNAVDRHLNELQYEGTLEKVANGIYYYPRKSAFGKVPPTDGALVRSFLKDDDFLLTSFNDYNKLLIGTTQLYNKTIVYNRKRQGNVTLGRRNFSFQIKPKFPKEVTVPYLLVDLVNNLDKVAEDPREVLKGVRRKVNELPLAW